MGSADHQDISIRGTDETRLTDTQVNTLADNLATAIEQREHEAGFNIGQIREQVRAQAFGYFQESMTKLRDENLLVSAEHNGEIVGTAGLKNIGIDPYSGNPVWEIVHVSVLPTARGSGLKAGSQLMTQVQQEIFSRDPNALIVMRSTEPNILEWAKRRNFRTLSFVELWKIENGTTDIPLRELEWQRKRDANEKDTRVYVLYPEER